ncbi:hypothetical protein QO004_000486 [Rhizobium mesoamericanum]|uniref:hypothetical protein n=1 Tax=Rhizobium mesoamericanum TaxID=1079800 RepID=UPI002784BA58|nr:hypothetical protein [Rhizobium mesoamericanum]MDQ0558711.1 hypothetical protein [Rhizobium mesoamericanum]
MSFEFSRRRTLGLLAGIAAPTTAVGGAAPFTRDAEPTVELTPEEQLAAAVDAMEAAMIAVHGQGVRIIRNENHIVSFLEPEKPRIVEWQGDGDYEVELDDKRRPFFRVTRFPPFDCFKQGRCYRLEPTAAKQLGIRYMFEGELQRALIRKIR